VLDQAGSTYRATAALLAGAHSASELEFEHQRQILTRCLNLIAQPVDPYEAPHILFAARAAATAIIQANPWMDAVMNQRLSQAGPEVPDLLAVVAAALQRRPERRSEAAAAALAASTPDKQTAAQFAAGCDTRASALDPLVSGPRGLRRLASRLGGIARWPIAQARAWTRWVMATAAAGAAAGVGLLAAALTDLDAPDLKISPGEAATALGLLVAAHVVAAELSAERLPGAVARYTSTPIPLICGYAAASCLMLIATFDYPGNDEKQTDLVLAFGLLLTLAVIATLSRLLARTDPVAAVEAFSSARRTAFIAAGNDLGAMHRDASEARSAVAAAGFAKLVMTEPRGARREIVRAERRGYLLLNPGRLRALGGHEPFRSERLTLRVASGIGGPAEKGEVVCSVLAAEDAAPTRREIKLVERTVQIKPLAGLDQVCASGGVLVSLAAQLAKEGNSAGAKRVAEQLAELVEVHLAAVRRSRGQAVQRHDVLPQPLLGTVVQQALSESRRDTTGDAMGVIGEILERVAQVTDRADTFAGLLAARLGVAYPAPDELPDFQQQVIWLAGLTALECEDSLGMSMVNERLGEHLKNQDQASKGTELAARLVQAAVWIAQARAADLYQWFGEHTEVGYVRLIGQLRIGAAALMAGHISLALNVAIDLRASDFDKLDAHLERREVAAHEQLESDLFHRLLGEDAQFNLQNFVRFAKQAAPAVS
jgi:hypothetical protein